MLMNHESQSGIYISAIFAVMVMILAITVLSF